MAKKKMKERKPAPWNKGVEVGQRDAFTPAEVKRIRKLFADRGDAGLQQLALFSTAIDTMLRSPDLLGLTVKSVRKRNGVMRDTFKLAPKGRRSDSIECTLSKATMSVLERLIIHSGKKQGDYLFTSRIGGGKKALSNRQFSRRVKDWTVGIGLDASSYGIESLRRTRAIHLLNRTGNLEALRILLGLKDIGTTARYLSDSKPINALELSRKYEI